MPNRRKKGRAIDGVLLLDKPLHLSSNHAVQRVKRLFNAQKAGHTGTLDPLATGVLPICLGHATKLSHFLLASDKSYQFTMTLGEKTATGDSEGEVVETAVVPALTDDLLQEVINQFVGVMQQTPPMYSALKHQGKPLYELARKGVEIERKPREIIIKKLAILHQKEHQLTFEVVCSKGTYIRTLAEDMAKSFGTCAHLTALRRIKTNMFEIEQTVTLEQLETLDGDFSQLDRLLKPMECVVEGYPEIVCSGDEFQHLMCGGFVSRNKEKVCSLVKLKNTNGLFFGLGAIEDDGLLKPKRIFQSN